jgi:hypothetical protein
MVIADKLGGPPKGSPPDELPLNVYHHTLRASTGENAAYIDHLPTACLTAAAMERWQVD